MATKIGPTAAAVEERLLAHGEKFSYFQAVRLLRLFGGARGVAPDSLRVRPKLGLAFPENDIDSIEALPDGGYRITVNFFGLYGVASPLPTYYTEDLFEEEREGRHATRDFLDVVHYAMYPLLFEAWRKPRLQKRIIEDADQAPLDQLFAFTGLHDKRLRDQLPHSGDLLRYAGLFNQHPRSAMGLQTLLSDAFMPAKVEIQSCTLQYLLIAADQQIRVGMQAHCLGENTHLGTHIDDYSGTLTVSMNDLPEALFHELLPGTFGHERLKFLARFYLIDPLEIKVVLGLRQQAVQGARVQSVPVFESTKLAAIQDNQADQADQADFSPAGSWSRLGFDTWLAPEKGMALAPVQFML